MTDLVLCIGGFKDGKLVSSEALRGGDEIFFYIPQPMPAPTSKWHGPVTAVDNPPKEVYVRHQLRGQHQKFHLLVEKSITADQMLQRLLDTYAVHAGEVNGRLARLPPVQRCNPEALADQGK